MKQIDFNKYWSPAFDTMSEFIYLLDKDLNVIKVNKAIIDFTKKDESYLTGKKCFKAVYDANKPLTENCPFKRMLKSKKFETLELFIPHRGKWFNIRTNPVFDEKNNLIGGITFSEDITARKKMEESLLESKNQFESFFENQPAYAYMVSPEGIILDMNRRALEALGYKKSEIVGKDLKNIYAKEVHSKSNKIFNKWKRTGKIEDEEMIIVTKHGKKRTVVLNVDSVRDKNGKILHSISLQRDITEFKKTEEEKEQLLKAVENAREAVSITGEGLKIIYTNNALNKLFGYKKGELIGKEVTILNHEEGKGELVAEIINSLNKRGSWEGEIPDKRKDGTKFVSFVTISAIKDKKGNMLNAISTQHDITERKNAERLLRQSEEGFRVTFENAKDAIFWADIEAMRIVKCNKAAGKLVERDVKEIEGNSHTILFPPEKIEFYNNMFKRHLKNGGAFDEPAEIITKSGKIKPILITSSITTIGEKKIMWGIFHDVGERKKTESALKESEEKFRTLAEESPNMIFINKKGKVIYANKKCEEIMGYKKNDFYSDKFDYMSTVDPKDHDKVKQAFSKHMSGKDVPPYEYTLVLKNGHKIDVIITTKLINYSGEKAIIGIITDITGRRQIEKMKDNLICDVSHSLKTPIAMTAMALEICKGAMQVNDFAQIKKAHSIAHSNIKKAHKDVNNILEIFTLESGRIGRKNDNGKVSLPSIFNEILKGFNYIIAGKGLKLSMDFAENAKNVEIYRKDAIILVSNILDNAIKFTEKGSISIKSRLKGNEIEIKVEDTGSGIEAKDIKKVFDKFYRCHPSVDGSGLGLAICKGIVDIYKGKIEARSKGKDQGTAIIVRFPKE